MTGTSSSSAVGSLANSSIPCAFLLKTMSSIGVSGCIARILYLFGTVFKCLTREIERRTKENAGELNTRRCRIQSWRTSERRKAYHILPASATSYADRAKRGASSRASGGFMSFLARGCSAEYVKKFGWVQNATAGSKRISEPSNPLFLGFRGFFAQDFTKRI